MRRGGGAYSIGNKPRIYGGGAVRHFPVVRHFSVFPAACFTVFSPRRKSRAATVSTSMASYMSAIRLGSAAHPHQRIRIHRQFGSGQPHAHIRGFVCIGNSLGSAAHPRPRIRICRQAPGVLSQPSFPKVPAFAPSFCLRSCALRPRSRHVPPRAGSAGIVDFGQKIILCVYLDNSIFITYNNR